MGFESGDYYVSLRHHICPLEERALELMKNISGVGGDRCGEEIGCTQSPGVQRTL